MNKNAYDRRYTKNTQTPNFAQQFPPIAMSHHHLKLIGSEKWLKLVSLYLSFFIHIIVTNWKEAQECNGQLLLFGWGLLPSWAPLTIVMLLLRRVRFSKIRKDKLPQYFFFQKLGQQLSNKRNFLLESDCLIWGLVQSSLTMAWWKVFSTIFTLLYLFLQLLPLAKIKKSMALHLWGWNQEKLISN